MHYHKTANFKRLGIKLIFNFTTSSEGIFKNSSLI